MVIHGLREKPSESADDLLKSVLELVSVKLGVKCDDIERCHRLGVERKDKPRPVIIKLLDFRTKVAILNNARKLKGTNIYINEDYSARVRMARRALWQNSQDMRKNAGKYRLKHDTLTIDGVRYMWDTDKNVIVQASARSPSTVSASVPSAPVKSASAKATGRNRASANTASARVD